ncbi:hypothetical protein [Pseudomonas sp. PS01301]|uniref:hypothetical protein n=1 Tax=Pseudomonas sp. PS01301 TaxID=2991437 RepID=UPI002499D8C1|nr:hypothetical protein [Pseudomonas sp. PS01301]
MSEDVGPFLVKQTVPGNPDPNPATPLINERLTPPTGIPAVVPAGRPLTVTIPRYVEIADKDTIVLYWSNREIRKIVSADEALNPGQALTVTVPADIIDGTPGMGLNVLYDIEDEVKNWSLFSLNAFADVIPPGALHAPALRDATDDDELDVDELDGDDVAVQIPVNGNLPVGTTGTLTWTGIPVLGPRLTFTLDFQIVKAGTRITLYVPYAQAAALVGSTATVYYEALIGGVSTPSQRISVAVIGQPVTLEKPTLVGVTGNTYNPALIGGTHQEVIVPQYGFMASGQTVILLWEGRTAAGSPVYIQQTHEVTSDTPQDIRFMIDVLYAKGLGTNTTLKVSYTIIAEGTSYASPILELTVVGVPNNLPKPTTEPVFQGGEIDPGAVGPTFKVVVEPNPVLLPDDRVTVHWEGRPGASTSITNQPFPSSGNLEVTLASDPYIAGNSNGYVEVWYEATRNSQPVGSSQRLQLHVGAAAERPWPLPKIVDGTNSEVSTWQPIKPGTSYETNTATVVVRDARILENDTVAVLWFWPDGQNEALPWVLATVGEGRVSVPSTVLALGLGQTVQVGYVIFRGADLTVVGTSQMLSLRLENFRPGTLKPPRIEQAAGNLLDLNTFTGDGIVVVDPWPFITAGQTFWLRVHGTLDDGDPYSERLATPYTVQTSEVTSGIRRVVERRLLLRLENASTLRVELKVDLSGTALESAATSFPEGDAVMATVKLDLPAPVVTGAENGYLDPAGIPATGVNVQVRAYGGRAPKQWVYVKFTGQNGSKEETAPVEVQDTTTPMDFKITKAEVLKNEKQAVTFEYKVARTQGALYSDSESVPVDVEKGSPVTPPGVDGFEDLGLGEYPILSRQGYSVETSYNSIRVSANSSFPPYIVGNHAYAEARHTVFITFAEPVTALKLGLWTSQGAIEEVYVGTQCISANISAGAQWREYQASDPVPKSSAITAIVYRQHYSIDTPLLVDNISFTPWVPVK